MTEKNPAAPKVASIGYLVSRLGVSRQRIDQLQHKQPLPEPVAYYGRTRLYKIKDLEKWLSELQRVRDWEKRSHRLIDNANGYFTIPEIIKHFGFTGHSTPKYHIRHKGIEPVDQSLVVRKTKDQYKLSDFEKHLVCSAPSGYVTIGKLAEELNVPVGKIRSLINRKGISPWPQKLTTGETRYTALYKRSEVLDFVPTRWR